MELQFPTEWSFYKPLANYLEKIGFKTVEELAIKGKRPDIKCWYNGYQFLIQIKIGGVQELLSGIADAYSHAKVSGINEIIVIVYPPEVREPISKPEEVDLRALNSKVKVFLLTTPWVDRLEEIKPTDLFLQFREKIETKTKVVSTKFIIETLSESIKLLATLLRSYKKIKLEDVISNVVGRFDLYTSLGETERKKENLKLAALDLTAYLLVNQILFYHLFSLKTKKVPELEEGKIKRISDLKRFFKKITDINYKAIYSTDIISQLPNEKSIYETIIKIVNVVKALKPENIPQDLLGRVFQAPLPFETRKALAAFYTKPQAAEILAVLTIDRWNEKVMDPACGSGTLLVAAYRRKLELGAKQIENIHQKFVEDEITGIDIMPFAAHLTSVNLSIQDPTSTTNILRVGCYDSLQLQPNSEIPSLVKILQMRLDFWSRRKGKQIISTKGAVGVEGVGESFRLDKVDTIIMNPPFTERKKLPKDLLENIPSTLINKIGDNANYWAYFVALADMFLNENGKIGAVLPANVFRGGKSKKLREYLFKGDNYKLRYIVKTTKEPAFSEGSILRDVLFIVEKRKPKANDKFAVVYILQPLESMKIEEAKELAKRIREIPEGENYKDDYIGIIWFNHSLIKENLGNLMLFSAFSDPEIQLEIFKFYSDFIKSTKLRKIKPEEIENGLISQPGKLIKSVFITRPISEDRIRQALLILDSEEKDDISFKIKNIGKKIIVSKSKIEFGLRTISSIKNIDITGKQDYILKHSIKDYKSKLYSGLEINFDDLQHKLLEKRTYVAISRRLDISSANTCVISCYSDEQFVPTNAFIIFKNLKDRNDAKILSLFLNSTLFFLQYLMFKSETRAAWIQIESEDMPAFRILDINKLSKEEKQFLLDVFNEVSTMEFPSIIQQFERKFEGRKKIDVAILRVLGYTESKVKEILSKLYDSISEELKTLKNIMMLPK